MIAKYAGLHFPEFHFMIKKYRFLEKRVSLFYEAFEI
jgi:hypothetical protein